MSVSPSVTPESSTTSASDSRIQRTIAIHAELMRLWEIEQPYDVVIALFPAAHLYEAVEAPEHDGILLHAIG